MTREAVKKLALHLITTELEGNRTTTGYRNEVTYSVKLFFSWMEAHGHEDIRQLTKADLLAYYRYVCSQKVKTCTKNPGYLISRRTISGRLLAVKKVFAALYRADYLKDDTCYGLELGVLPDRGFIRHPFTEAEMAEFLEQIDPSTPLGLRDRTLFELIYSSGLRVSEVSLLTMRDVDLERREIVVHGKGSRDRLVPISPVARDFLRRFIGDRINRLDEPVFLSRDCKRAMGSSEITQRFGKLLVKFGMDGKGRSTHAVRHSTATHLLDHGASVRHIQELLGHKSINTTVRYTQVQTDGLAKIYRKYHPGEHELFETIDEAYIERLDALVAGMGEAC